jgi:hypothetical protein
MFEEVRAGNIGASWTVRQWNGSVAAIPGHSGEPVEPDDMDRFVNAVVDLRIRAIRPGLKAIRKGFRTNTGLRKRQFITGAVLSRAAQGSPTISIAHLKAITDVARNMPPEEIARFWRVVSEFDERDKSLLLRFITTQTRLPNPTIGNPFRIAICRSDGVTDQSLPMAATCFNRLSLPVYTTDDVARDKILLAIRTCVTMENK